MLPSMEWLKTTNPEEAEEFIQLVKNSQHVDLERMSEEQLEMWMGAKRQQAVEIVGQRKAAQVQVVQAAKTDDELFQEAHQAEFVRLEEIQQQRDNWMKMPEWKQRQDLDLGVKMRALAEEERHINDGLRQDVHANKRAGVDAQMAALEQERLEIISRTKISPQGGISEAAKRLTEINNEMHKLATIRHYGSWNGVAQ